MPNFKYVGAQTKPNGKVDLKLPKCSHGSGPLSFIDIEPNVTVITVTDPCHVHMVRLHKDVSKSPPQALFAETA